MPFRAHKCARVRGVRSSGASSRKPRCESAGSVRVVKSRVFELSGSSGRLVGGRGGVWVGLRGGARASSSSEQGRRHLGWVLGAGSRFVLLPIYCRAIILA